MADCPFSPWRSREDLNPGEIADLDARPPSALDDLALSLFADLYKALAVVMSPAEADECELWQLAALLGMDRQVVSADPLDRYAAEIEATRELARQAGIPDVKPPPVDVTAQMAKSLGIDFGL